MPDPSRAFRWSRVLLALTVLSPLLVFVAVAGIKLGLWDWRFGYSTLTMRAGLALAGLGAAAALGGLVVALGERRTWPLALAGLAFSGVTGAVYAQHLARTGMPVGQAVATGVPQATTDRDDPPAFAGVIADRRAGVVGGSAFAPCDAATVPTQVAPGAAAYALEQAGFTVEGFGVGRADGSRRGLWFGFAHDATIRIRPGETDIRVASREVRPDDGEACRLVRAVVSELQVGP